MKELPWALKDWSYEAMKQKQTDSDEIVRELRDWSRIYGHALGPTYTQMNDRAASRILALKADLAQAQRNASNALDDYHTLKAELASVKAAYKELARHIERIAVRAENLEYECGQVVSGVSELNDAVAAYRAATKEMP